MATRKKVLDLVTMTLCVKFSMERDFKEVLRILEGIHFECFVNNLHDETEKKEDIYLNFQVFEFHITKVLSRQLIAIYKFH
jgi:hypothetical protein